MKCGGGGIGLGGDGERAARKADLAIRIAEIGRQQTPPLLLDRCGFVGRRAKLPGESGDFSRNREVFGCPCSKLAKILNVAD